MLDKLIEIQENDLTKEIIVPLFTKIYGCRVAFTGGINEQGRDAIVYKKSPLDECEFIGIQVKRQKLKANSKLESFQQLINQLSQMASEPTQCPDTHQDVYFSKHIFITPYEISEAALKSHKGALQDASRKNLTIIDGKKLLELIERYAPELKKKITGEKIHLAEKIKPTLTNKALMKALSFVEDKNICDIFCETNLSLGNSKLNPTIYTKIKIKNNTIDLTFKNLSSIKDAITENDECEKKLNISLYDIEALNRANSLITQRYELERNINQNTESIIDIVKLLRKRILESQFAAFYPSLTDIENFIEFINTGYKSCSESSNSDFLDEILEFRAILNNRQQLLDKNDLAKHKLAKIETSFNIKVNFEELISEYRKVIDNIPTRKEEVVELNEIKNFLLLSKKLEYIDKIINKYKSNLIIEPEGLPRNLNIKISIENAFLTGLNIVVLGEAGSGKTTNLQIHTLNMLNHNPEDLTLYITLSDLAISTNVKGENNDIFYGLFSYLTKLGSTDYSVSSFHDYLLNEKTYLILDSIDEAIVQFPWIIDSLHNFSNTYEKCQIITSSRFTVKDISNLDFVSISLMPFDDKQKQNFFDKWFVDNMDKSKKIINHLKSYPELNNVVTNPLSATIMATLQNSSVPLPCTEAQLYKKRFELLSGLFDKFKGVNRNKIPPELILKNIILLAYKVHLNNERDFTKDQALNYLSSLTPDESNFSELFDELISPCEIILSTISGKYSFGHLRFQEYLVSEQLVHVRNLPLDKYLTSPWWHDVFLLYSQHAFEIEWIINYVVSDPDLTKSTFKLMNKMISFRSIHEQQALSNRLEIALQNTDSDDYKNILDIDDSYDDFDISDYGIDVYD